METNERLKNAVIEVVENQLEENNPPETRQTYERLVVEGHSEQEAKKLIGAVVVSEVFGVLQEGRTFDPEKYAAALDNLPEIPQ